MYSLATQFTKHLKLALIAITTRVITRGSSIDLEIKPLQRIAL